MRIQAGCRTTASCSRRDAPRDRFVDPRHGCLRTEARESMNVADNSADGIQNYLDDRKWAICASSPYM